MFPHFSRRIAVMYTWFGLISIPLLTLATTISIANVFTHGQIAGDTHLQFAWAFLFAAAIEVNIVRLFFEAKLNRDTGAFVLGIVLASVAGAALLIEGLQQSTSFNWNALFVQWIVGIVIALRVIVVILLVAREGSRLAAVLIEQEQPMYACLVSFPVPVHALESGQMHEQEEDTDTAFHLVSTHAHKKRSNSPVSVEQRIRTILNTQPSISVRSLAKAARVSVGTAQRYKKRTNAS